MRVPTFILQQTNIKSERMYHFYITAMLWIAAFTLYSYSITIFLNEALGSPFWVGLFLGIGSAAATFLDVPFGYLQKILSTRILLSIATLGLMLSVGIFLFSYTHAAFLALAGIIYALSHDLYDVTMLSYVFNRTIPAEYGQNISQKSVFEALGIVFGLVFSGFFLQWGSEIAQIALEFILLLSLVIILFIFDRESSSESKPVSHKIQELKSNTVSGLKNSAIAVINITEQGLEKLKNTIQTGTIVLKPIIPSWRQILSAKMFQEMAEAYKGLTTIVRGRKFNIPLVWSVLVLFLFSFWDTFVITFEPLFLAKFLAESNSYRFLTGGIIMTLFILPLFVCLIPFSRLADKYGRHNFIMGGLAVSGVSLVFFGLADSLPLMIMAGMSNSLGYAAVMPSVQALFAEKFSEHLALSQGKTEIDSHVSASPLKMILNFANVLGQVCGGTLIYFLGFNAVFMIFGALLCIMCMFSLAAYAAIAKPPFIYETVVVTEPSLSTSNTPA